MGDQRKSKKIKLEHLNNALHDNSIMGDNNNDTSNINIEEDSNNDASKIIIINELMPDPCQNILTYQEELIKMYFNRSNMFKTRKCTSIQESNDKLNCLDYLELANLGNKLNLTETEGDLLLKTFNDILERHNNTSFKLPKCWSMINKSVFNKQLDQKHKDSYKIEEIKTLFDDKLFDANSKTRYDDLKIPYGVGFNILQTIGDQLLRISPKTFNFEPVNELNEDGDQVFGHFCTSDYFHKAFKSLENRFNLKGSNLKDAEGYQIIPLCVSFSIDATTLARNTKVVEPIVMFILNMDSPHAIFLGMTPNCHILLKSYMKNFH